MATHIRSPPKNAFGKYVLNEEGNPVPEADYLIWEKWFENDEDCVLKQDTLPGDVLVSTMFLGLESKLQGSWSTHPLGNSDFWRSPRRIRRKIRKP